MQPRTKRYPLIRRELFPEHNPGARGMRRHVEVDTSTSVMADNEETI